MTVAARHADGWNAVVTDAGNFAQLAAQVELCHRSARQWPLGRAAQGVGRDIDLDVAAQLLCGLEQAGADAVTFVLVEERGPDAVRELAEAVPEGGTWAPRGLTS